MWYEALPIVLSKNDKRLTRNGVTIHDSQCQKDPNQSLGYIRKMKREKERKGEKNWLKYQYM